VILISSTGLKPVSLLIAMAVPSLRDEFAIMRSILLSRGIFGTLAFSWYLGLVHVKPCSLT